MGEPVKQKTYYQVEATGEVGIVQKGETLPDGAKSLKKGEYEALVAQQDQGGGDNGGEGDDQNGATGSGDQGGDPAGDDPDQGGGGPDPQEPAAASDEATGELNRDGFAPGQEVSFQDIQAMRVKQRQVWERAKREQREKALQREAERLSKQ